MKINYIILLLLMIPIATADFGYVPRQTINNITYDSSFGKYVPASVFIENKMNYSIILNLKTTANIIAPDKIIMTPKQRLNLPITIFVTQDKQTETIAINEKEKNFGGVMEIIINAHHINISNLSEVKAYALDNQYNCTTNKDQLNCNSPLKNVTMQVEYIGIINRYTIGAFIVVLIAIGGVIYIIKKEMKGDLIEDEPNEPNQGN